MRYLVLILLLATPAYAVDTALIDRDGVTTSAVLAPVALSGSASDITTGTLNAARLPATYLTGNQSISFAPTGDVSSSGGSGATSLTPALTVAKIQGVSVDATAPTTNDVFQFNGTSWLHVTPATLKGTLSLVKGDVGLGSVENTALSTWAGSANITTLGTISSGTVPVARIGSLGTGVATALGNTLGGAGGVTTTIASGTTALGTSAIASGACAAAATTAATNVATTDVINWGFNGDPTGVTGYAPSANGMLTIIAYPTAGNVNFKVCNLTAASITPSATITLNWRINR